jgi:hypothetical protein
MSKSDFDLESGIVLEGLRNRGGMNPDWADALRPLAGQLGEIIQRFEQQAGAARNSGEFSQKGLATRLTAIANEARKNLTTATAKELSAYRDRRTHAQQRMVPANKSGTDFARELRAWELRTLLRAEDPLVVQIKYEEAIRMGDHELIEAIHGAPRAFPLVSDAVRTEQTQVWLESQNPEVAKEARNLTALEETLGYLVKRAEQLIDRDAPANHDVPIEQAA